MHLLNLLSTAAVKCEKSRLFNWLKPHVIARFREEIEVNGSFLLLKIILFSVGHSQKSAGVRSGEYGGQETGRNFPTALAPKCCSISLRLLWDVCDGAPSCMNQEDFRLWFSFNFPTNHDTQSPYISWLTMM